MLPKDFSYPIQVQGPGSHTVVSWLTGSNEDRDQERKGLGLVAGSRDHRQLKS